jgi:O-antigen ligase
MKRVDFEDVVTLNRRTFAWETVWEWIASFGEGVFFGNGYVGNYYIGLLDAWGMSIGSKNLAETHSHSHMLQLFLDLGLIGIIVFLIILFFTFNYYKNEYRKNTVNQVFYPFIIYLFLQLNLCTYVSYIMLVTILFQAVGAKVVISSSDIVNDENNNIHI